MVPMKSSISKVSYFPFLVEHTHFGETFNFVAPGFAGRRCNGSVKASKVFALGMIFQTANVEHDHIIELL